MRPAALAAAVALGWALVPAVAPSPARAQDDGRGAIETLELLEQRRPSEAAAPAALELGRAWLARGDWLAAAGLLQEAVERAASLGQADVAAAARNRLAAVERLRLRPEAGRPRWPVARLLEPSRVELGRPIGVAAREDGELAVVDDGKDVVVWISPDGRERTSAARKARRPLWGRDGEIVVVFDDGHAEVGGAARAWPPAGLRDPLDVARDPGGGWLALTAAGVERRADDGGERQVVELEGRRPAIAIDSDPLGNLYLLEEEARRVVVYDRDGGRLEALGPALPGGLELRRPHDVAVDDSGRIYIADRRLGIVVLE